MKFYEMGINGFWKWVGVGVCVSGKLLKKRNKKGIFMEMFN